MKKTATFLTFLLLLGACTTGAALGGYSQEQIVSCLNSLTTPEGVLMQNELAQATANPDMGAANAEDTNYTELVKVCRAKGIF